MVPTESLVTAIKREYITEITRLMEKGVYNLVRVQEVTRQFMLLLPFQSFVDMQNKLKAFTLKHEELNKVWYIFLKLVEEAKTSDVLSRMQIFIKKGQFNDAISLTKVV